MAGPKIEGLGGEVRIKVDIDIDSPEYQAYLAANREKKRLQEVNGCDVPEGIEGVRRAVVGVDKLANKELQKQKAN